ncbi:MAG: hypothetical protein ABJA18_11995 [bacterium]
MRERKHNYGTGSGPGSPRGQPAWGGGSDLVSVDFKTLFVLFEPTA